MIGSCGRSIFRTLRNLHTVIHSVYRSLHSHQQLLQYPLPHCVCVCVYFEVGDDSYSILGELKPQCDFYLHFPDD